jgi:hypothetical protein
MTHTAIARFNYQADKSHRGCYDFGRLLRAFATVQDAPSIVQFCEAQHSRDHAGEAKYACRC